MMRQNSPYLGVVGKRKSLLWHAFLSLGLVLSCIEQAAIATEIASPGKPIVAVVFGDPTSNFRGGLFKIDPDTGARGNRLGRANGRRPLWSPDHESLVYATGRLNETELWVVAADGTSNRQITTNRLFDEWPSWAPDSKRVVVERFDERQNTSGDLYIVRADGSGARNLTSSKTDELCPTWASDRSRIGFMGVPGFDLYTIKPSGKARKRITSGAGRDGFAQWSPSGVRLLFHRVVGRGVDEREALFTVRRDGSRLRRLTDWSSIISVFGWSPNGKKIVFVGTPRDGGSTSLSIMNADGSREKELDSSLGSNEISPGWSADGTTIVYEKSGGASGFQDLWSIKVDGSGGRRLTHTDQLREAEPTWYAPTQQCRVPY